MLITLHPQKLSILAVGFSFVFMLCLQLMLPKKTIQESKIRGGELFRLNNCQNKGCRCLYGCERENVKNAFNH